jgi:hypothetical protein
VGWFAFWGAVFVVCHHASWFWCAWKNVAKIESIFQNAKIPTPRTGSPDSEFQRELQLSPWNALLKFRIWRPTIWDAPLESKSGSHREKTKLNCEKPMLVVDWRQTPRTTKFKSFLVLLLKAFRKAGFRLMTRWALNAPGVARSRAIRRWGVSEITCFRPIRTRF